MDSETRFATLPHVTSSSTAAPWAPCVLVSESESWPSSDSELGLSYTTFLQPTSAKPSSKSVGRLPNDEAWDPAVTLGGLSNIVPTCFQRKRFPMVHAAFAVHNEVRNAAGGRRHAGAHCWGLGCCGCVCGGVGRGERRGGWERGWVGEQVSAQVILTGRGGKGRDVEGG